MNIHFPSSFTVDPTIEGRRKPNQLSEDAIMWMEEIFNDPSHNNDIFKFATENKSEELKSVYNLTS